jgi:hypothetical protein
MHSMSCFSNAANAANAANANANAANTNSTSLHHPAEPHNNQVKMDQAGQVFKSKATTQVEALATAAASKKRKTASAQSNRLKKKKGGTPEVQFLPPMGTMQALPIEIIAMVGLLSKKSVHLMGVRKEWRSELPQYLSGITLLAPRENGWLEVEIQPKNVKNMLLRFRNTPRLGLVIDTKKPCNMNITNIADKLAQKTRDDIVTATFQVLKQGTLNVVSLHFVPLNRNLTPFKGSPTLQYITVDYNHYNKEANRRMMQALMNCPALLVLNICGSTYVASCKK